MILVALNLGSHPSIGELVLLFYTWESGEQVIEEFHGWEESKW